MPYQQAWEWQRHLAAACANTRANDSLLLLEHPPTITLGRAAKREHLLVPEDELARRGVAVVASDRGGDVTYHAPGQLVGYPILKLSRYCRGLLSYLRGLEEVLIRTLATYDIAAVRIEGLTGVWVQTGATAAKIAAIGIRLNATGVTAHGFALNINPDLAGFNQIVPCGIADRGVTSIAALRGWSPPMAEVSDRVVTNFAQVFDVTIVAAPAEASNVESVVAERGDPSCLNLSH
ncbi:MAG: lipoyl(octanoyl) transferase LipB [Chloroflexaceae bacterium]|nr:lipoyl(octanoyl) transferase LipB [Chloroflexaceae bacterium]